MVANAERRSEKREIPAVREVRQERKELYPQPGASWPNTELAVVGRCIRLV